MRIGYAVAQPGILRRMADRREAIDRQGDIPLEQALANLIQEGVIAGIHEKLGVSTRDAATSLSVNCRANSATDWNFRHRPVGSQSGRD